VWKYGHSWLRQTYDPYEPSYHGAQARLANIVGGNTKKMRTTSSGSRFHQSASRRAWASPLASHGLDLGVVGFAVTASSRSPPRAVTLVDLCWFGDTPLAVLGVAKAADAQKEFVG
jgi:hypothetical protein